MNQDNLFGVSLNPTIILVVGLIIVTVIGNRWRRADPTLPDDERIVSERIDDDADVVRGFVPDFQHDPDSVPELGPVEPQRLRNELLLSNPQPIGPASVSSEEQDEWITPPRPEPARLELPDFADLHPTAPVVQSPSGGSRVGSLVSSSRYTDGREEASDSFAPVLSVPADLDRTRRTHDEARVESGEAVWGPVETIAPGRAERLMRLPKLPQPAPGNDESRPQGESSPVDLSPAEFDPSALPPLAPPQAQMNQDMNPWSLVAAECVEPAAALRDQLELTSPQRRSTDLSIDNDRPLNRHAVRMSEVTATKYMQAAVRFAGRRAFAAAHAELETALKTLAAGADASSVRPTHVHSVTSALLALREAEDFFPGGAAIQHGQSVREIAKRHRTIVVRDLDRDLSATEAVETYYGFAQQSLLAAVGHSHTSSDVLYQLGKLYTATTSTPVIATQAHTVRATLFHQTALVIDESNYRAANELGVLLAKSGQWQNARTYLLHSLTVQQLPEAWFNLSKVHDRLGEADLAARARYEYKLSSGSSVTPLKRPAVQWVSPQQFGSMPAPTPASLMPAVARSQSDMTVDSRDQQKAGQTNSRSSTAQPATTRSSNRWMPWPRNL